KQQGTWPNSIANSQMPAAHWFRSGKSRRVPRGDPVRRVTNCPGFRADPEGRGPWTREVQVAPGARVPRSRPVPATAAAQAFQVRAYPAPANQAPVSQVPATPRFRYQ